MLFWFKGKGELAIVFQYLFQKMNKEEKSRKNNYRKTAKLCLNRLLQGFYYQYQPKKKNLQINIVNVTILFTTF